MVKRPPKLVDVLGEVRRRAREGDFLFRDHAFRRARERRVSRPEVQYVLAVSGYHEKSKDCFKESNWRYAIRGETLDRRDLRIVVVFDRDLVIVTVIDLDLDN